MPTATKKASKVVTTEVVETLATPVMNVPEVQELTVFQKNSPDKEKNPKKITIYQLMVLTYLLVTGENATPQEKEDAREGMPFMDVTPQHIEDLTNFGLVEIVDSKPQVTNAGIALALRGTSFGVNFDRLVKELSFDGKVRLIITLGASLKDIIKKPITINNLQNQPSQISRGLRQLVVDLGDLLEWPEQ